MANIQALDRVTVERIKQDGEHVPLLRTVIFLLHREGVEEKLRRKSNEKIFLGAEGQGFDGSNLIRALFLYCFLQKDQLRDGARANAALWACWSYPEQNVKVPSILAPEAEDNAM